MDKKLKLKNELRSKLKQEMTGTGTGASVTPGAGEGVATKYAFGKVNKSKPAGWKEAPSIPNRPSKAMDYKELWEDTSELDTQNSSTDEILTYLQAAKQNGTLSPEAQEVFIQWMNTPGASRDEIIKVLRKLTGMHLKEEDDDEELDYDNISDLEDELRRLIRWSNQYGSKGTDAKIEQLKKRIEYLKAQSINEGYARFRNETKTRTKPEQFHSAVKQVKQKVNEINRLFEYMNRLQSELSESEGGLKYKKYTEKSIQQIKESTKSLFFKSTKLK